MLTICLLAMAALHFQIASSVPRRFSQLEGNRPAPMPSIDDKSARRFSSSNSVEDDNSAANDDGAQDCHCSDGWMNFHNKVCFYGLNVKRPFFDGVEQCGKLGANFTSIHSMEEFNFITTHWSLEEYWIGIVRYDYQFQDGTEVNQTLAQEFDEYVPWAYPPVPKGFICRALPGQAVNTNTAEQEQSAEHDDSSFEHEHDDNSSMERDEDSKIFYAHG